MARPRKNAEGDGTSKAELIRQAAKEIGGGGSVRPRDIIAHLREKGVEVASAQVSTTLAAAGFRRKRRRRGGGRPAGSGKRAASHGGNGAGLNIEALVAAKALVAKVGSLDAAEEAIKALKRLQ